MDRITRFSAVAATGLGALVAGVAANRLIVVNPAWAAAGARAWADYTRVADLGRGRLWYPAVGLAALACSAAAAASFSRSRSLPRRAAVPLYGAALYAIGGLVVTATKVVPPTLSVVSLGGGGDDALAVAFATASRWWNVKAALHLFTFGANVWAVAVLWPAGARTPREVRWLIALAVLLGGMLAGGNVDRTFIQMPAWHLLGPAAWADFSRNADMGNGFFWYPAEAVGAAGALVAALVVSWRQGLGSRVIGSRTAWFALIAAVACAIAGLLATTQAAPKMLSIRAIADGQTGPLQNAFDGFRRWGDVRGLFQVASFVAALLALARPPRAPAGHATRGGVSPAAKGSS